MRYTRIFLGVFILSAAIILAWTGFSGIKLSQREEPRTVVLPLPAMVEILPEDRVVPGTFKLVIPWEELLQKAAQSNVKTLVTYSIVAGRGVRLKYWLPRDSSTMYYAEKRLDMKWPWHTWGQDGPGITLNGNSLTVAPVSSVLTVMLFIPATILVLVVALIKPWKRKISSS